MYLFWGKIWSFLDPASTLPNIFHKFQKTSPGVGESSKSLLFFCLQVTAHKTLNYISCVELSLGERPNQRKVESRGRTRASACYGYCNNRCLTLSGQKMTDWTAVTVWWQAVGRDKSSGLQASADVKTSDDLACWEVSEQWLHPHTWTNICHGYIAITGLRDRISMNSVCSPLAIGGSHH